ncbi:cell division protein [Bifidobacterium simiarum]|uniref:Cell division protein n=1 Tax=Bifidobacterium simiarum TaxID=2045441 RepID=A0A2M9HFW7_9BIFI|nr:cell division protein [Bifidobacterium simiarum]PJM75720.1 cell division protein [Bifidobacterium simiarum]
MNDFRGHVPDADDTGDSVVARQMNGRDEAIVDLDDSTHITSVSARQASAARPVPAEAAMPVNDPSAARPRLNLPGLENLPDLPGLGGQGTGANGPAAGGTGYPGGDDLDDATRHSTPRQPVGQPVGGYGYGAGYDDPQDTQLAQPAQSGQPAQTEYAAQSQYPTQTAADQTAPAQTADRTTTQLPRNIQAFLEDDEDEELATKNQFTTVFDVLERMETLVEDSKSSFFSGGQVRVDREELTGLIRELKSKLPVQLERASALMRESERRLENAQSQASSIVASAQSRAATIVREANEQAQFLVGQENVVALATERARSILDTAQTKADRLTQGADRYSASVLNELLNQLDKATHGVQSGLDVLAERQKEAAQRLPHLSDDDYPRQ